MEKYPHGAPPTDPYHRAWRLILEWALDSIDPGAKRAAKRIRAGESCYEMFSDVIDMLGYRLRVSSGRGSRSWRPNSRT